MTKVAIIGVGKLGQDCAEVMANTYDVVGYDTAHRTPYNFPMLLSIKDAVIGRDIIFIAAPTAHDPIYGGETPTSHLENKDFDYSIVTNILCEVNKHANKEQLVVLISTVLPGTVRNILEPCITNARFIYNPYLIAMGTTKWDMVNPEMIIIGTKDGKKTRDAVQLIDFYKAFMENDPRYEVGTWDEAESIKIFYNTWISTKVVLVNMMQDVAEANGNINVDIVTGALSRSTHRITGPSYMTAGMGDGGACHPRDNIALRFLADRLDLGYDVFDAIMRAREVQAERMAKTCLRHGTRVCIVGKAYKPSVPYTNGSSSMLVGHYIEQHGGTVMYYDPNTGDKIDLNTADVFLIGYWERWVELLVFPITATVIDPWRKITDIQHSGAIIHYGNTRKKDINEDKHYTWDSDAVWAMYKVFSELVLFKDRIHACVATAANHRAFIKRPIPDVVAELNTAMLNGKDKIIFDTLNEPLFSDFINRIHAIIAHIPNLKASDVYHTTCSSDGVARYNDYCTANGITDKINIIVANFYEYLTSNSNYYLTTEPTYLIGNRPKKFLCLNKIHRYHRIKLIASLLENDLVNSSLCSFYGSHFNADWTTDEQLAMLEPVVAKTILKHRSLFPMVLNAGLHRNNPIQVEMQDLELYSSTYYSIVTETCYFNQNNNNFSIMHLFGNATMISEKTYKTILMKHPFLLMSTAYLLKELRGNGYKTFAPFINEAYDEEEDDIKRFDMIIEEIKRLDKFTTEEWITWQHGIKDIVEHNFKLIRSKTDFAITRNITNDW